MHIYIKSAFRRGIVLFRGFMFAESTERNWYSYLDGYVCQPDVAPESWPGLLVQ